jgi:hypothetical protein
VDWRYAALVVPVLGLLELGGHFYFAGRAPSVDEWKAAREPVAALKQPNDLVVIAPHWAEPLARHAFGDGLMPVTDVARPDASRYARAIEVGILGQIAPELAGWKIVSERDSGDFRLRVLENSKPAQIKFDFVRELEPERVHVSGPGGECAFTDRARVETGGLHGHVAFPSERFACGGQGAHFVGVTVIDDQEYRPRRCIWAHPAQNGPLRIRFQAVPLGDVVRGYAGLSYFLFRDGEGAPVSLTVNVAGASIGRYVHRDETGWHPFEMRLGKNARSTADVEFVVESPAARDRQFCFHADTR